MKMSGGLVHPAAGPGRPVALPRARGGRRGGSAIGAYIKMTQDKMTQDAGSPKEQLETIRTRSPRDERRDNMPEPGPGRYLC
jgi:hypothetical protein